VQIALADVNNNNTMLNFGYRDQSTTDPLAARQLFDNKILDIVCVVF
jgi:hypothetical protein